MVRIPARSIWLQSIVVLAVIIGIIAGDITIASARVAANHKRAELRKLHRAEAAYVAQVDAISHDLFINVQPVQNALDNLDANRPQLISAARDAVVNTHTSAAVAKLDDQLTKLHPTTTLTAQHNALHAALQAMTKQLAALEKGKKAKESSDMLDEPYAGAALSLSLAEDDWQKTLLALDTKTHRAQAPSPGATGSSRPRVALPPTKASWIFGADQACSVAGHAIYSLPPLNDNTSEAALIKYTDKYAAIIQKIAKDIRALKVPTADKLLLQRGVLRSVGADEAYAASYRELAQAVRRHDIGMLNKAIEKGDAAEKGMSTLSHQMASYGAEFCGFFFNPKAKPTEKNGGSGTITA